MFKWIFRIVGILIVLIILAVIAALVFINPNDYKAQIQNKLSQALHRQVELNGPIHLTVFPNIGVRIEKVAIINPRGYAINSFASIGEADVSVKLLPLLASTIRINHVLLKDAEFNLIQTASGSNWQFGEEKVSYSSSAAKEYAEVTHTKEKTADVAPQIPAFNIGNLSIKNSVVNYYNQIKKSDTKLNIINFSGNGIASDSTFPMSLQAAIQQGAQTMQVDLNTKVNFSAKAQSIALSDMTLISTLTQAKKAPVTVKVSGNAAVNLTKQTATLDLKNADAAGANLNGKVNITDLLGSMQYEGTLNVKANNFNGLNNLATLPSQVNEFAPLQSSFTFSGDNNNANLRSLQINAGKFAAQGFARVSNFKSPNIIFDLNTTALDLDKLMSKPTNGEKSNNAAGGASSGGAAVSNNNGITYSKAAILPLAALHNLDVTGKLSMAALTLNGITLVKPTVNVDARNGVLAIKSNRMGLGGGTLTFNSTGDAKRAAIGLQANADNIDVEKLQQLFSMAKITSGTGHVDMTLRLMGNSVFDWVHSMNGQIDFALNKGTFRGVDLNYWVAQGNALINKTQTNVQNTKQTDFDTLRATLLINRGVISNNNLLLSSQHLKTTGDGTINLPEQRINYSVSARFQDLNARGKVITIPIRIQGSLTKPNIAPDVGAILKDEAQRAIKRESQKFLGSLKDKLGGLF